MKTYAKTYNIVYDEPFYLMVAGEVGQDAELMLITISRKIIDVGIDAETGQYVEAHKGTTYDGSKRTHTPVIHYDLLRTSIRNLPYSVSTLEAKLAQLDKEAQMNLNVTA